MIGNRKRIRSPTAPNHIRSVHGPGRGGGTFRLARYNSPGLFHLTLFVHTQRYEHYWVIISLAHMYTCACAWVSSFVLYIFGCFRSWLPVFHSQCSRLPVPSIYQRERDYRTERVELDSGKDCGSHCGRLGATQTVCSGEKAQGKANAAIGVACLLFAVTGLFCVVPP